jgi:hypothetical protein
MVMLASSCGGSSGSYSGNSGGNAKGSAPTHESTMQASYSPAIKPSGFTTKIDNKYFPLKPGTTFVYRGKTKNATERDVMSVTDSTKQIMGVKCVVVDDTGTPRTRRATSGISGRTPRSIRMAR